jgi:hypothetical protein
MFVYYTAATDKFGTTEPHRFTQFECLNELKDPMSRSYDNLLKMNRFVFECDTVDKQIQEERALKLICDNVACRAVDSGNKSIHVIIELADEVKSVEQYKQIWRLLNKRYFNAEADTACSNPNRLTRRPNAIRMSNNVMQKLLAVNNTQYKLDATDLAALKSEEDRQNYLSILRSTVFTSTRKSHDGMCEKWDVVKRYLDTPFPKMTGNVNSSKWLYAAIKTCQKYDDNQTLDKVLNKARREHWSEQELQHKLK